MFEDSPSQRQAEQRALDIVSRRLLDVGPGATFGRFTLEQTLGRGAHGHVYAASDPMLRRDVALKIVRCRGRGSVSSALAEARALAAVEHPALVEIFEVVEHGDAVALVMERVRGQTLDAWIATRPSSRAIDRVFETIGRGLAAVHDAGLVHRDVKPANVLVGDDGRPRIIDFGLAVSAEPAGIRRSGTPSTMAPEQFDGEGVGPWSDQYAWAVAYREALSQTRWRGRSGWRTEAVLRRAAAYRVEERYPSMRAALAALARRRAAGRGARWVLGATALVGSGLALPGPRPEVCPPEDLIVVDWDPERATAVRDRVEALGGPLADEAAERVVARLDFVAERIGARQAEVCEAGRVDGPRRADQACLAELAAAMEHTVHALHDDHLASATEAVELVALLGDPTQCASRALVADAATPEATEARGRLRAKSALCAAQTAEACRAAFDDELRGGADSGCGLALDARYQRGLGLQRAGDAGGALDELSEVAWRAERCARSDLELDAKRLAGVLSAFAGRAEAADVWLAAAEATLHRTGEQPYGAARLELARGLARMDASPGEGAEILAHAVEMLDAFGAGSIRERAVALVNLGQARRRAGHIGAAEALRDALELQQGLYGPRAMIVGHTLVSLAGAMHAAGHPDAAQRDLGRAADIYRLHEASGRAPLIDVERNRCALAREQGALRRAAEHCTMAIELATQAPELPARVELDARASLALVWAERGELERAATMLQTLRERAEDPGDPGDRGVPPGTVDEWTANLAAIEQVRERHARAAELWCSLVEGPDGSGRAPWAQRLHRGLGCVTALLADGDAASAVALGQPLADALTPAQTSSSDAVALRARLREGRAKRVTMGSN